MTKARLEDLAVFGGSAAFAALLHVGRPNIGDRRRFLERVNDMLDRRWLTNHGPFVLEFERAIAEHVGVKHCVSTCNATTALQIAARALELKGEVIVPSFTFVATAHAIHWLNLTPVFCDVDPRTHNLDPAAVERLITPRTTGIIGVHVWGRACDVKALTELASRHKVRLLFDAAHAFGASCDGRMIGNFGDAEVFSFHSTKWLNTFEGGAIVTNDDRLADKLRLMTRFGFDGCDHVVSTGTNGKMSEVSAAMGLTSLESCVAFVEANRRNYQQYHEELRGVAGVSVMHYDARQKCSFQYIVIEIDSRTAGITRDQLMQVLWAENILARRYFYPGCHRMEPYRTLFPFAGQRLPHTESLTDRVLLLPNGSSIEPSVVGTICHIIRFAVEHGEDVGSALSAAASDGATPPYPVVTQ